MITKRFDEEKRSLDLKRTVSFIIFFLSSFHLFCSEDSENFGILVEAEAPESAQPVIIDKTVNYSAKPANKKNDECLSLQKSYEKYVFEARYGILADKKDKYVTDRYIRHLQCWNDPYVYKELAEYYKSLGKLYPAGLTYKKAGMMKEYNEVKKLKESIGENDFQLLAIKEYRKYNSKYIARSAGATVLFVAGPIAALTGLGLLISSSNGNEDYSKILPYGLIFGGMMTAGAGILVNLTAEKAYNTGIGYLQVSQNYSGDPGTLPSEYFKYSGIENEVRKMSAKSYQTHGAGLIGLSLPLIAVAIYGFFDSAKGFDRDDDSGGSFFISDNGFMFLTHLIQILTFAPAIACLAGGITMLVKGSADERLNTEPSLFTLDSITPVINPVSKTYGLSLGFSF